MYSGRGGVFTRGRRRPVGRYLLLFVAICVAVAGIYTAIDNGRVIVRTQRVFVANLPSSLEGFTILHLSDLNAKRFGPAQKQLAGVLKNRRYSAVCITGDMVGPDGDVAPFKELLLALDPSKPVYYIAGNSDPAALQTNSAGYVVQADWRIALQQMGQVKFLDTPKSQQVGNATVWFSDAMQLSLDLDEAAAAYGASSSLLSAYQADIIEQTRIARRQMGEGDLHIALTHDPLTEERVLRMMSIEGAEGGPFARTVDLVLAGGAVGGGWKIPFAGPVWFDGWFPRADITQGYHYAASLLQYISAGLGTNAESPLPDFRLFNTPEVTLITFTSDIIGEDVLPDRSVQAPR